MSLYSVEGVPGGLRVWSGPACVAAVTGTRYEFVLNAFKEVRRRDDRSTSIKSVTDSEMTEVLDRFGFKLVDLPVNWKEPEPSLASWIKSRIDWVKRRLILLRLADGDYVVVYWKGGMDASHLKPAWLKDVDGRRKKVVAAWVVARKEVAVEVPNQVVVAVEKKLRDGPNAVPAAMVEARKARTEAIRRIKEVGLTFKDHGLEKGVSVNVPKGMRIVLWTGDHPMTTTSFAEYGRGRWTKLRDRLNAIREQDILRAP